MQQRHEIAQLSYTLTPTAVLPTRTKVRGWFLKKDRLSSSESLGKMESPIILKLKERHATLQVALDRAHREVHGRRKIRTQKQMSLCLFNTHSPVWFVEVGCTHTAVTSHHRNPLHTFFTHTSENHNFVNCGYICGFRKNHILVCRNQLHCHTLPQSECLGRGLAAMSAVSRDRFHQPYVVELCTVPAPRHPIPLRLPTRGVLTSTSHRVLCTVNTRLLNCVYVRSHPL